MNNRARLSTSMVVAATAVALLSAAPHAQAAQPIGCGSTITSDATLTRNLTCSGSALTVAPGVRLDLGGRTIKGDGSGAGIMVLGDASERATTIVNGRVTGFVDGIVSTPEFVGTDYPSLNLDRLTLTNAPVRVEATELTISRSALRDSGINAWSSNVTAADSSLKRSTATGEMLRLVLQRSHVLGGSWGADENETIVISDSTLDGTGAARSATVCFQSCSITNSVVRDYDWPIWGGPVHVSGSTFVANSTGALAIEGESSVTASSFVGNGGVALQVTGGPSTISGNRFARNQAGLLVSGAEDVTVADNTFRRNLGDGARSEGVGTVFSGNSAVLNGGWGLYAPQGTDGGGNVARRNGAGNCAGLVCSAS